MSCSSSPIYQAPTQKLSCCAHDNFQHTLKLVLGVQPNSDFAFDASPSSKSCIQYYVNYSGINEKLNRLNIDTRATIVLYNQKYWWKLNLADGPKSRLEE